MNLLHVFVFWFIYLIYIIETKKFRIVVSDETLPYLDPTVRSFTDVLSFDNYNSEIIDDEFEVSGFVEWKISKDQKLPVVCVFRTQYYENSKWNEGLFQASSNDACAELTNKNRPFYNITKLWTNCPPQKGDKWVVEHQFVKTILDLPSSIPIRPWRAYILAYQGLPGFEKSKDGYGFSAEIFPV